MDLETRKVYTSRDIVFHEHVFPFSDSFTTTKPLFPPTTSDRDYVEVLLPQQHNVSFNETPLENNSPVIPEQQPLPLRKSTRGHKAPGCLSDYVYSALTETPCFVILTNLCLQPPTMSTTCLASDSLQFLERLDFTDPRIMRRLLLILGGRKLCLKNYKL